MEKFPWVGNGGTRLDACSCRLGSRHRLLGNCQAPYRLCQVWDPAGTSLGPSLVMKMANLLVSDRVSAG